MKEIALTIFYLFSLLLVSINAIIGGGYLISRFTQIPLYLGTLICIIYYSIILLVSISFSVEGEE